MLCISRHLLLLIAALLSAALMTVCSTNELDTIVLVTGSSSGIGKGIALAFASEPGFKVYASMRNPERWDQPPQDNLVVSAMDVSSEDSVNAAVNLIEKTEGRGIDIVVNNAGYGIVGTLETVKVSEAKELFDVNVWGPVRVLQAVLPGMRKRKKGQVINISSTSGIRGVPCFEYYTGSKFALEGIMDSLRYSLIPYNISVTNVNAGPVRTGFTDRFGNAELGGRGTREVDDSLGFIKGYIDKMLDGLQHRMQSAEAQTSDDVARLVVNLVKLKSEAKSYSDVPFNFGSSKESHAVLTSVRKNPTGWGGIYSMLADTVPPLPETLAQADHRSEL